MIYTFLTFIQLKWIIKNFYSKITFIEKIILNLLFKCIQFIQAMVKKIILNRTITN